VYAIPILFYAPGDTLKGIYPQLVQQIDIMPSVLDYLGYNKPFFAMGNSIFSPGKRFVSERFTGSWQWLMDGHLLQTNDINPTGLFAVPPDSTCWHNLLKAEPGTAERELIYLEAFTQQYNNALVKNRMWIKQ
jgi:arylsulfatase A-like enzyme